LAPLSDRHGINSRTRRCGSCYDRPMSAEEVEAKLKSEGWSNITILSEGKYLQVSGLLNGKASKIAIDSQTGRLRASDDDDGDDD